MLFVHTTCKQKHNKALLGIYVKEEKVGGNTFFGYTSYRSFKFLNSV